MRKKQPIPFAQKFPNADPLALRLLERLLAFDPKDRPTAEEVFILFSISYVCVCVLKNHSTQIINCFLSLCFFFGVWTIEMYNWCATICDFLAWEFWRIWHFQALADPYFKGLSKIEREPSCQPITKMEFEFERRRVTKEEIGELIFREILEYHPQLLKDYINGTERTNFLYPRFLFF